MTFDGNNTGQGMTSAFIEEIRQKLGLNLQSLLTATKAAATYLTPAQAAAAYQPLSTNIAKLVYQNGSLVTNPIIAVGATTLNGNGSAGPYAVTFSPVTFAVAPVVQVMAETASVNYAQVGGGGASTTGFNVFFTSAIGVGTGNIIVRWTAVGA
jgi:hypothetical protein